MTTPDWASMTGEAVRLRCRDGRFDGPTAGVARGFTQANLVILPEQHAADFGTFCTKNPKPCPLLEATEPGVYEPRRLAPGADVRRDLPRYRVLQDGICTAHPCSIEDYWPEGARLVAFLIGCSFTFERALLDAGLPVRHIEEGCNVPMYRTSIACDPAGPFSGPLVVSMRPMTSAQAEQAERITSRFPKVHGAPVQIGHPESLGIDRLDRPDYGDPVTVRAGEIPVFWACGVTPMEALLRAHLSLAIVHEPGHMFVTDLRDRDLEVADE